MYSLKVGDIKINFDIRKSLKAKRSRIIVRSTGVEVVASKNSRTTDILNFVEQKKLWIFKKSKELENIKSKFSESSKKKSELDSVLFRGVETKINFIRDNIDFCRIELEGDMNIFIPSRLPEYDSRSSAKLALRLWLKDQLMKDIYTFAKIYCGKIGKRFHSIKIKNHKRIWGSCTSRNVININFQLIFVPAEILEYVVLHEICHMVHRNHSRNFWDLVEQYMPDYKSRRKWLRDYSRSGSGIIPSI